MDTLLVGGQVLLTRSSGLRSADSRIVKVLNADAVYIFESEWNVGHPLEGEVNAASRIGNSTCILSRGTAIFARDPTSCEHADEGDRFRSRLAVSSR